MNEFLLSCSLSTIAGIFGVIGWTAGVLLALLLLYIVALVIAVLLKSDSALRSLGKLLIGIIYRVDVFGEKNLPKEGFLLLPNHVSYVDAVILQLSCPRPIRFVIIEEIYNIPVLKPILVALKAIPIAPKRAKEAIRKAAAAIEDGEIVCVFPEGELTRSGSLLKLKKGFELIARQANAPVLPVWLDELWGSIFSYHGGKYFTKLPRRIPYHVSVAYGEPIDSKEVNIALVREKLLELGEFCYQRRPILKTHLGEACLRGLKKNQFGIAMVDGMDDSELKGGNLLAASITLSKYLRENCPDKRISIVLPPGKGVTVANLAVLLAGKVPVNLNFTAGQAALEASIKRGEVTYAITAKKMEAKLGEFPWPEHVLYLEKVLPPLKKRIIAWRIAVLLIPASILLRIVGVPKIGGRDEAVLLFTSGSSGDPKGVVLSHHNVLGNVSQFGQMIDLKPGDSLLASLPIFHSFGCTVTLWFPLIEGIKAVSYTSPLETAKNIELIEKHRVSMVCTTPTFLRGYLRKAKPEQLKSLKLMITGAEKLPDKLASQFEEKFGIPVMQGYGLTETSPVASVCLPDPEPQRGVSIQPSFRKGSAGKLAPGMAARLTHPETGEPVSLHETGMLWFKGPNIFEGYLGDQEKTREVIDDDGWFKTGDLGRFDEDGFLFIEGRLSRFSKIGGEMVPHETVENAVADAMEMPQENDRTLVITSIPDAKKGEAIALLTTQPVDKDKLREKLTAAGLPNLFIPKIVIEVEEIPHLATGKLDLRGCREKAMEMAGKGEDQ